MSRKDYLHLLTIEGSLKDGTLYLITANGYGRYLVIHQDLTVTSDEFRLDNTDITEDERDALAYIVHAMEKGWQLSYGEFVCMYCGASAMSPRVVNIACPCRHGASAN